MKISSSLGKIFFIAFHITNLRSACWICYVHKNSGYTIESDYVFDWNRAGIQQKRSSWQDGVLGTNCPIPPKWNWTYNFQVKDQIGSYFYFPSLNFQRASGGFGGFIINPRSVIPTPFDNPAGDIVVLIGDWYIRNHTVSVRQNATLKLLSIFSCRCSRFIISLTFYPPFFILQDLRKTLDAGKALGMPDGVLINGKGPYRYNDTLVPDNIDHETINVEPGD